MSTCLQQSSILALEAPIKKESVTSKKLFQILSYVLLFFLTIVKKVSLAYEIIYLLVVIDVFVCFEATWIFFPVKSALSNGQTKTRLSLGDNLLLPNIVGFIWWTVGWILDYWFMFFVNILSKDNFQFSFT